ncbi:lysine-specific demethylase 6B [Anguilla anguilla]|uniref:lysine-specific demethylase 6B n=1 Tax=Anguilla anguilla TaxID=7936 RepID=UPI0015AE3C25|nr:lysine-specific demethylase 6B [Anguilla anguilla]XP_035238112.1 lysine-specific demethylase 6B [Anguilla anguilla]XP_035238113.1 lysine-specific demethylase 6B [Anguilla anguilla]XP_035238114.1 lysine-specific demethylase 6B [Anguilla anguilla]
MSSAPDRAKECLPPKKRESRQGSSELTPADDFKPPAPLRTRPGGRQPESKEPGDGPPPIPHYGRDLLPPPPPPPPLPAHKFALPWPLSYPTATPGPFSTQMGERCGSNSPAWRDQCARGVDPADQATPHHSRWQRGEASHGAYKSHFPTDSREIWSYYNAGKHSFSPSLFSHTHLFPQPPLYPKDPPDPRRSYPTKRPNGFDRMDGRHLPAGRLVSAPEDYLYDTKVKQTTSSHTNGKRRYQDEQRSMSGAALKDSHALEGPSTHSSLQDKGPRATLKAPPPNASDARTFKVPLDALSMAGSPGEAHIYYALGPMYSGLQQPPLAYPLYSTHNQAPVLPLYGLQTDTSHPLRNSQLSPLVEAISRHNSHSPDQTPVPKPPSHSSTSPGGYRSHSTATAAAHHSGASTSSPPAPQPSILLPHFARGSLIELSGGRLKRVEDLQTEDFLLCADTSPEFHLSSCTILLISPSPASGFSHLQVLLTDCNTQELLKVLVEYPFFVRDRGWSSCCPQRTAQLYGLRCRQLSVGDVCLALTPAPPALPSTALPRNHAREGEPGRAAQGVHNRAGYECSAQRPEKMAPPAPAPPPPLAHAPPSGELTQGRKRRWSAPELLGTDRTPPDLPHSSKHRKQQ